MNASHFADYEQMQRDCSDELGWEHYDTYEYQAPDDITCLYDSMFDEPVLNQDSDDVEYIIDFVTNVTSLVSPLTGRVLQVEPWQPIPTGNWEDNLPF